MLSQWPHFPDCQELRCHTFSWSLWLRPSLGEAKGHHKKPRPGKVTGMFCRPTHLSGKNTSTPATWTRNEGDSPFSSVMVGLESHKSPTALFAARNAMVQALLRAWPQEPWQYPSKLELFQSWTQQHLPRLRGFQESDPGRTGEASSAGKIKRCLVVSAHSFLGIMIPGVVENDPQVPPK